MWVGRVRPSARLPATLTAASVFTDAKRRQARPRRVSALAMSYPDRPTLQTDGMTKNAFALRPASEPELDELRPLLAAAGGPALRLATSSPHVHPGAAAAASRALLRSPDLVSDLRRARAVRFADRYEWLSLRRRRAQIAARHALELRDGPGRATLDV